MTDTPSTILLTREQSTGSNTNLWGGYLITTQRQTEQAMKAVQSQAVTGDFTTSWTNYTTGNVGQAAVLRYTGALSAAATNTMPAYQNFLLATNAAGAAITTKVSAGTGVALPNNRSTLLFCDGTDYYSAAPTWLNTYASPLTNNGDIVVKTTLETAIAAASGLTAPFILNSAADTTPGYNGAKNTAKTLGGLVYSTLNAGANEQNQSALDFTNLTVTTNVAATDRFAVYDATAGAMRYQVRSNVVGKYGLILQSDQTSGFTAAAGNLYPCDFTSAGFLITFPASASRGDIIGIAVFGANSGTFSTNSLLYYGTAYTALPVMEGVQFFYYSGATRGWIDA